MVVFANKIKLIALEEREKKDGSGSYKLGTFSDGYSVMQFYIKSSTVDLVPFKNYNIVLELSSFKGQIAVKITDIKNEA